MTRRWMPLIAVAVALLVAGVTTFALGGTERRPQAVPPIMTPRLRAIFAGDAAAPKVNGVADDELAVVEDETPTLNVLKAGGLPEEPVRHDFELGMERIKKRVDECRSLEQFVGMVQVHVVIERSGGVKSAQALAPLDETKTGQCVAHAVRSATFSRFRGTLTPTIELIYPFYFRPSDN